MLYSKNGQEMLDLMEIADQTLAAANSSKSQDIKKDPNGYTRDELKKMVEYISTFIKNGKQMDSWAKYTNEFNQLAAVMKQFITVTKGDPALTYKEGSSGDIYDKGYDFNKPQNGRKAANSKEGESKDAYSRSSYSKEAEPRNRKY